MKTSEDEAARTMAWKVLESRGYEISDISSGSGVPRGSRLKLRDKSGNVLFAAVKKSTLKGRFSFKKDDKNKVTVLPEMDIVIHVQPRPETDDYKVSAFDRATVAGAFADYQKAIDARGLGHIPLWVNPNPDKPRMVGSGFSAKAIWSVLTSSLSKVDALEIAEESLEAEVIALISKRTGYHKDRIKVDIHLGR